MTQSIPSTLAQTCRPNRNLLSKEVMERKCSQLGLFGRGARSSPLVVWMCLRLCTLIYPIPTRPVVAPKGAETATLLENAAWTSNSQAARTEGYPRLLLSIIQLRKDCTISNQAAENEYQCARCST